MKEAKIAILRWEKGLVPEGLMQLERMKGNSTNRDTYPFPVKLVEVPGAGVETVITSPSQKVLQKMIEISKKIIDEEGICAITTSCGFNAIFQNQLANFVSVPILTSSILQIPIVENLIGKDKKIAVITANRGSLTKLHFQACGIKDLSNIILIGLEEADEWNKIFTSPDESFDEKLVEEEIMAAAKKAVESHPSIGAFVLECTDLPPFSKKIQQITNIPVFDFVSMIGYMAISLGEISLY